MTSMRNQVKALQMLLYSTQKFESSAATNHRDQNEIIPGLE